MHSDIVLTSISLTPTPRKSRNKEHKFLFVFKSSPSSFKIIESRDSNSYFCISAQSNLSWSSWKAGTQKVNYWREIWLWSQPAWLWFLALQCDLRQVTSLAGRQLAHLYSEVEGPWLNKRMNWPTPSIRAVWQKELLTWKDSEEGFLSAQPWFQYDFGKLCLSRAQFPHI